MDRLRAVAFGATPGVVVPLGPDAAPRERWLAAVAAGGQGRYAVAAALLDRLVSDPDTPPAVAAHAAVTRAAHRRQLGGHAGARADDGLGLRLASAALTSTVLAGRHAAPDTDGTDAAAARVDALVGLAADAVGLGQPLVAARLLDSAESSCRDHPSWRVRVRIGWVRAELALLRGDPAAAVRPAARAVELAAAAGAARHLVKSRIVHAVARSLTGELPPAAAVAVLDGLAEEAVTLGLLALSWPCHLAAADLIGRIDGDANEFTTRMAQRSASDTTTGATRRRHAALVTMSVIVRRSHPLGRGLIGVSMRPVEFLAVM